MEVFALGLALGLAVGLACCWLAYLYGQYRGLAAIRWAGYGVAAKAKRKE